MNEIPSTQKPETATERNLRLARQKFGQNMIRPSASDDVQIGPNDISLIGLCRALKHGTITVKVVNGSPSTVTRAEESIDLNKEAKASG